VLPVHDYTSGLLAPGLGYLTSCLGMFLGLRCASRARPFRGAARARWLLLGGVAIGTTGIWLMHVIALLGFTIPGQAVRYNVPVTMASLLLAVALASAGLLIAGSGGQWPRALAGGGLITGLGLAGAQYLAIAALRTPGRISYAPAPFAASLAIAGPVAAGALWAAFRLRRAPGALLASLVIGAGVGAMHYAGMAAIRVRAASGPAGVVVGGGGGAAAGSFLIPAILGISVVLFAVSAAVAWSPTAEEASYHAALLAHVRRRSAAAPSAAAAGARSRGTGRGDAAASMPPWALSELRKPPEPGSDPRRA
jgi:NO-binding membrane sensor protein with MHYT domain